jgi:hypothetical protein
MVGKEAYIDGLKQLGYKPEELKEPGENRVAFSYVIREGRFKDRTVLVGVEVPPDFPVTCPTGPHISEKLIPMNPNGTGNDKAVDSPFGTDWMYLSRPLDVGNEGWNRTTKEVKAYIKHVKRILETL